MLAAVEVEEGFMALTLIPNVTNLKILKQLPVRFPL